MAQKLFFEMAGTTDGVHKIIYCSANFSDSKKKSYDASKEKINLMPEGLSVFGMNIKTELNNCTINVFKYQFVPVFNKNVFSCFRDVL